MRKYGGPISTDPQLPVTGVHHDSHATTRAYSEQQVADARHVSLPEGPYSLPPALGQDSRPANKVLRVLIEWHGPYCSRRPVSPAPILALRLLTFQLRASLRLFRYFPKMYVWFINWTLWNLIQQTCASRFPKTES